MRVVLDTNVFISGFRYGGKPKIVFEMAIARLYTLLITEDILLEIEDVLSKKFGWPRSTVVSTLERVARIAEPVHPNLRVNDCVDPDDNRILEAAVEGAADCIVSGDGHLLRMKTFRGIEILTVSEFLLRIETGTLRR
jgi:putative PIN family toxin of toxin-antitoxin system